MSSDRHDMSDPEWEVLNSVLPQDHQGPERLHGRRVTNGIFVVLRTGTPWRDLPERFDRTRPVKPATTGRAGTVSERLLWKNFKGLRAMTVKASMLTNHPRLGSGGG